MQFCDHSIFQQSLNMFKVNCTCMLNNPGLHREAHGKAFRKAESRQGLTLELVEARMTLKVPTGDQFIKLGYFYLPLA